jgi:hypothetical protein
MADATSATSTTSVPASQAAKDAKPAVNTVAQSEFTEVSVTTKLRKETRTSQMIDCLLIAHADAENVISQAFDVQDAFENESKFSRAFLWDAVIAQAKIMCNTAINDYVRLLDKAARLKPRMTREAVEEELLASRKARAVKERADRAAELKAKL